MAKLNKVEVPVAVGKKTKLDLSCDHVTTGNFGIVQPVYYRHMIKGERLDVNALCTCRLAPLAVPTYGRMRINTRAFFVPYSLVFPQWDAFYTDVIGSNANGSSLVTASPCVEVGALYNYFTTMVVYVGTQARSLVNNLGTVDPTTLTPPQMYDFYDGANYWSFTPEGRRCYKIMRSLGYNWPWEKGSTKKLSALPLLCWAKVYLDWYANQAYLDTADTLSLKQMLSYNDPTGQLNLTFNQIEAILNLMYAVVYDGDYFTASWDRPMSPISGQESSFSITDPTNNAYTTSGGVTYPMNQVVTNSQSGANSPYTANHKPSNGTPYVGGAFGSSSTGVSYATGVFTQFVDTALHRLTDFCKRNALAGNAEIDRYLARFGASVSSVNHNRSIYVGGKSIDVNVGDVMSTANTASSGQSSTLGDYAGRGQAQDGKSWSFTADEFGMFIITYSILPSGGYYQGIDRNNLHLDKFDFFVPEADGLSVQSISKGEVYISPNAAYATANDYDGHFAFTGRYGEYKRPISWCTGDMIIPSVFQGGDSWNLFREFDDSTFGTIVNQVHSLAFTRFTDYDSYNRIFQYTGSFSKGFFTKI